MEKNEIKKALYKQNPPAQFVHARADGLFYQAVLFEDRQLNVWEDRDTRGMAILSFLIPFNELGESTFEAKIDAKLLIRYLI